MSEYVPGSIFCASDHLNTLLCKCGYIRRGKQENETDEERFAKAVMELHTTIFYSYEHHWTKLVNVSWRARPAQEVLETHAFSDPRAVHGLLCELALWFLIYTGGAERGTVGGMRVYT
jgi:1,3-beta-glucan synthase